MKAHLLTTAAAVLGASLAISAPGAAQDDKPLDRVLNGVAASIEEFPWQVGLVREGESIFNGQFCGGSVIADTWILTAAHCFGDGRSAENTSIYWGSASLEGGGRLVDVERVVIHPGYGDAGFADDIALVELAEPISAQPVRLATPETASGVEAVGSLAVVTGWGEYRPVALVDGVEVDVATGLAVTDPDADFPDSSYPTELQSLAVPIVSLDACSAAYGGTDSPIDARVICAGAIRQGYDACNGDSGGPLQTRGADGRYIQVGIVSWGRRCDTGGYYNVYTRVSAFNDWIAETMAGRTVEDDEPGLVVSATFGRVELNAGFPDDPISVALAAGGAFPAERLDASCRGNIARDPDVSLVYQAGSFPLYISAASEADTTLVVLDPEGGLSCMDDFSGLNPAVSFEEPVSGEYFIWVGTYAPISDFIYPEATLYISELDPAFGS